MLGVLKRRWKPKRSSASSKIPGNEANSLDSFERDKRPHQVHPLADGRQTTLICYEKTAPNIEPQPPPASAPPPSSCYPLAPNICVEAGRIQFVRRESEVSTLSTSGVATPTPPLAKGPAITVAPGRVTVTRGLQTEWGDEGEAAGLREIQIFLENRIAELETALETAQKNESRDKQTINKLTKQLNRVSHGNRRFLEDCLTEMRDSAQRDADRERRLRADSESRTKQALQEAARCRSRLKLLTAEFQRMEETVRAMLVYKKQAEQLKQEKAALTLAFENRCQQYQSTISRLNSEISTLRQQLDQNSSKDQNPETAFRLALQRQAEESRKQYEKCLDDVASQVVRALLAQKGLREEVGFLNTKIHDLETQNRALASMLVHQLRSGGASEPPSTQGPPATPKWQNGDLIDVAEEERRQNCHNNSLRDRVDSNKEFMAHQHQQSSLITNIKHCNSFNSEVFEASPISEICDSNQEKRLSADTASILDTRLSFEDKKRHQVLTRLWTELKGSEVTPKKLLEALSAVDSALWVPPKRPVSLNLHLPIIQTTKYRRTRPVLAQSTSKSEEETTTTTTTATTTGNESPESGNRDEGYSTMSSDVQTDATVRGGGGGDATLPRRGGGLEDLKEASDETDNNVDNRLLVADNKDPDILYIPLNLLNLNQRNSYPPSKDILPFQHIMRSFSDSHLCIKITTAPSPCYSFTSPISSSPSIFLVDITEKSINPLRRTRGTNTLWGNAGLDIRNPDEVPQLSWSGTLEDRLECAAWDAEYIQHWLRIDETRSAMQQLELEYDRAELEDWSLSLSNEDQWKGVASATTPGQVSVVSTNLPSIQEHNALELEEDSNECLWNDSSYLIDKEGREIVTLLMDSQLEEKQWPYQLAQHSQPSPDNSWSSAGSDCCNSHEPETCSKRSSVAGSSDDTGELPAVGTDFTRDFYRLVKFESTKSLASTSSRSLGDCADRDAALQNVLTFIAEQQMYIPRSPELTKEFNIEGPQPSEKNDTIASDENYVTLKQLCEEFKEKEKVVINHAEEVCLVTPIEGETENCSDMAVRPVDICSSVNVEMTVEESQNSKAGVGESTATSGVVSRIPRRRTPSRIPVSPARALNNNNNNKESAHESKLPKSKIPHKSNKSKVKKQASTTQPPTTTTTIAAPASSVAQQHPISSERLPGAAQQPPLSNIIEGPPHRAVSFHERATSKDVIDELNRMIRSGEEQIGGQEGETSLDKVGSRATGWVHVERDIDLTDPKARANLLDVMMASVSSDSSPTSSCGGSVASDSTEDPPNYEHLHRIHKYHRQKKAHACRPEVVRGTQPQPRPTIMGRQDFYHRYGEKEKEAVASFDFLDELEETLQPQQRRLEDPVLQVQQNDQRNPETQQGNLTKTQEIEQDLQVQPSETQQLMELNSGNRRSRRDPQNQTLHIEDDLQVPKDLEGQKQAVKHLEELEDHIISNRDVEDPKDLPDLPKDLDLEENQKNLSETHRRDLLDEDQRQWKERWQNILEDSQSANLPNLQKDPEDLEEDPDGGGTQKKVLAVLGDLLADEATSPALPGGVCLMRFKVSQV